MGTRKVITCIFLLLSAAPLFCQNEYSWVITDSLTEARYFFEAQRISEYEVLIVGGRTLRGVTRGSEIYDARTKKVRPAASMVTARYAFASVVLPNGEVLVCGGSRTASGSPTNSIEIYDPKKDESRTAGTMVFARWQHCAIMLDSRYVLIVGGWGGPREAEIFDITTNSSTSAASFPYISSFGKVARTKDGKVIHFSGRSGGPDSYRTDQVHAFNVPNNRWELSGTMTEKLYYPTLTTLSDGRLLLTGGSISEGDTRDNFASAVQVADQTSFSKFGSLFTPRAGHEAVEYGADRVIVLGGMDNAKQSYFSCEWVNSITGAVAKAPPMHETRRYFRALTLNDGQGGLVVVAISGQQAKGITPLIEELGSCSATTSQVPLYEPFVQYLGSGKYVGSAARLTGAEQFVTGGLWVRNRMPVIDGFDVRFSFRMLDGNDNGQADNGPAGADGIALILQNESRTALGMPGDGIGYNGMPHGIAVEFDSYLNPAFTDPSGSHIGVQVGDGMIIRPWHVAPYLAKVQWEGVPLFVADGRVYYARVSYNARRFQVYCSLSRDLGEPLITIDDFDIPSIMNLRADGACYIGFTSSTGRSSEMHEILSIEIDGCSPLVSSVDTDEPSSSQPFYGTMRVQPNPVASETNVEFSDALSFDTPIEVVDNQGRILMRTIARSGTLSVRLSGLDAISAGMYRVVVVAAGRTLVAPLVIVR